MVNNSSHYLHGAESIIRSLIALSLLLTLLTVLLSAYIRLAEVGIGCEPWPQCYAILNPEAQLQGIAVLTEQGRDMGHRGARLAHRYIASTLGIFIVVLFVSAWRQRRQLPTSLAVPGAALLITVLLSILGYYTPSRDQPLITMGNLLGGMALLALLWWLMQRLAETVATPTDSGLRRLALLALILVSVQIGLGGWSSANYASGACAGLVSCDSQWPNLSQYAQAYSLWREVELDQSGQVVPSHASAALTMTHRTFALLTAAYLAWLVRKLKQRPTLRASALAMSAFSISLILVGVSSIWWSMPLWLLSLHNGLAAGLLLCSVQLLHRLTASSQAAAVQQ